MSTELSPPKRQTLVRFGAASVALGSMLGADAALAAASLELCATPISVTKIVNNAAGTAGQTASITLPGEGLAKATASGRAVQANVGVLTGGYCSPVKEISALAQAFGYYVPVFSNDFLTQAQARGITSIPLNAEASCSVSGVHVSGASAQVIYFNDTKLRVSCDSRFEGQRRQSANVRIDYSLTNYINFGPADSSNRIRYVKSASVAARGFSGSGQAYADPILSVDPNWEHADLIAGISFEIEDVPVQSTSEDTRPNAESVPLMPLTLLTGLAALVAWIGARRVRG